MIAPPYATGSYGITHVDVGALQWAEQKGARSLLDVGCGPGGQVQAALQRGWRAIGIEVDPTYYRSPGVALIDLCTSPITLPAPAELVWSVEVAEHIPPEHTNNYLLTLTANTSTVLVVSCNQNPGPLHINCRPIAWWIQQIEALGMTHRPAMLKELLMHSTMQREFIRDTGMVFTW